MLLSFLSSRPITPTSIPPCCLFAECVPALHSLSGLYHVRKSATLGRSTNRERKKKGRLARSAYFHRGTNVWILPMCCR